MSYQKIDVLKELRKLKAGKPTKASTAVIAACAIPLIQDALRDRDAEELKRLFLLQDTRPND
jgi:hypothetical protein